MPKLTAGLILFGLTAVFAQETQSYRELFNVNSEAEVILNTSHADIEFATWDKNEVLIEVVITLEGATPQEAKAYFEHPAVEIMGNSSRVEVSTRPENTWGRRGGNALDFEFEMPAIPEVGQILEKLHIPEIPELPEVVNISPIPPMPPMAIKDFDYKAYEQQGEAYLKRWKKDFDKKFKYEYQAQLEEWSERTQERAEKFKTRQKELEKRHQERAAQQEANREQAKKTRLEAQARIMEVRDQLREDLIRSRESLLAAPEMGPPHPKAFFLRGTQGNLNFNIQKIIKITLPKQAKLQLNVRHGAVKLAASARDLKANLAYASLHASDIEGSQTQVAVKFAPVSVKNWNSGRLSTEFSEAVVLDQVRELDLLATSSIVTIDKLLEKASIENNLGELRIESVAPNFKELQLKMRNAALDLNLPEVPFNIQVQQENSTFQIPEGIIWKTKPDAVGIQTGYFRKNNPNRTISLGAIFSTANVHL